MSGKAPRQSPESDTLPTTRRLEAKIKHLQEQIRSAEEYDVDARSKVFKWSNPLLSGGVEIIPAPLEPLINCYPWQVEEPEAAAGPSTSAAGPSTRIVSTVPRALVHQELDAWDRGPEVPPALRHLLLAIFLPHRDHMSYDLYLPRLRTRFLLPSTHPDAYHPSFMNAICMGACVVAGPDFAVYENLFHERCIAAKDGALSQVDRMEDCLWSTIMLGWYFLRKGNELAAHALGNSAARWAIACGIHQLSNPALDVQQPNNLLGPYRDMLHFAERVNLWWAVFLLDRRVALTTGLPPSIHQDEQMLVTTVWPRSFADVLSNPLPALWRRESIEDLFVHGTSTTDVTNDSLLSMTAKCGAIFDRALWLSAVSKARQPNDAYWTKYIATEHALLRLRSTIPDMRDQREIAFGERAKTLNPMLLLARGCNQAALISLYLSAAANGDAGAREKAFEVTNGMMRDVRVINDVNGKGRGASFVSFHPCLGPTWFCAAQVCIHEIQNVYGAQSQSSSANPGGQLGSESLRRLRNAQINLDAFVDTLARLTARFPTLLSYIRRLAWLLDPSANVELIRMAPVRPGDIPKAFTPPTRSPADSDSEKGSEHSYSARPYTQPRTQDRTPPPSGGQSQIQAVMGGLGIYNPAYQYPSS